MIRACVLVLALTVACVTAVSAQNLDAIKERKDLLGKMGEATKAPGKMMKQEVPFDQAAVLASLEVIIKNAAVIPNHFPDDSKEGGKTEALPVIWENKDDFTGRFEKLVASAKAAKDAVGDEFEFMETWPKVVGNCGGCHKKYRVEKK